MHAVGIVVVHNIFVKIVVIDNIIEQGHVANWLHFRLGRLGFIPGPATGLDLHLEKLLGRRGDTQQGAVMAVAGDEHEPDRKRRGKRQGDGAQVEKIDDHRVAAQRAVTGEEGGVSATSAMVGATIGVVGMRSASSGAKASSNARFSRARPRCISI